MPYVMSILLKHHHHHQAEDIHVKIKRTTTQGVQWDLTITQNVVFREVYNGHLV